MIIERCRELALRASARVVFPDALDQRVLKAAQYLHQQGLATPFWSPIRLNFVSLRSVKAWRWTGYR